jgi:hypothetical protein
MNYPILERGRAHFESGDMLPQAKISSLYSPVKFSSALSRNHATKFEVAIDNQPPSRAHRDKPNSERFDAKRLGGKLPPRTAKLAVPPRANCIVPAMDVVRAG